jgi:hypothetical protein
VGRAKTRIDDRNDATVAAADVTVETAQGRTLRTTVAWAGGAAPALRDGRELPVSGAGLTGPPGIAPSGAFGGSNFNAQPTGYFGTSNPFTGQERRGVVTPNANTTLTGGGGGIQLSVPNPFGTPTAGARISLVFNTASGSRSQSFGSFDPLGDFLLVLGTGDPTQPFPAGVAFPTNVPSGTAGGINVMTNIFHRRDITLDTFAAEISSDPVAFGIQDPSLLQPSALFAVSPFVGFSYTRLEVNESTSFSIPGFLTDGAYNSNYDNDVFTAYAGLRLDVPLRVNPNVFVIPYAKGSAGIAISNLEGDDRLDLSGLVNIQQRIGLSANHTGFVGAIGGGLNIAVGDFCFGGSVTYTRADVYANLVRPDRLGPTTQVQFTESDAVIGSVSARYAFGAPRPRFRPGEPVLDTQAFATCP